jgi:hypothetical protein
MVTINMQIKHVLLLMYLSMRKYKILLIIGTLSGLYSCSADYHYRKALKKGLEAIKTQDTIRITTLDSIPVISQHHDTIIYEKFFSSKDTIIIYDNVYVPQTRLEIRTEYKIRRDTIRMHTRIEKQIAKASKGTNYFLWIFLILLVLLAFRFISK